MSVRTMCYREKNKGGLEMVVRAGLLENVAFEKSLQGDERGSLVDTWEQGVPERESIASAKALRSECDRCVQGALWLGQIERERGKRREVMEVRDSAGPRGPLCGL